MIGSYNFHVELGNQVCKEFFVKQFLVCVDNK
jgi:hypothetical protein